MANLQVHQLPEQTTTKPLDLIPIEDSVSGVLGYTTPEALGKTLSRYAILIPADTIFDYDGFTNYTQLASIPVPQYIGEGNLALHVKYSLTNDGLTPSDNFMMSGEIYIENNIQDGNFSNNNSTIVNHINTLGNGYGYKIAAEADSVKQAVNIVLALDDSNSNRTTQPFSLSSAIVGYMDVIVMNHGVGV